MLSSARAPPNVEEKGRLTLESFLRMARVFLYRRSRGMSVDEESGRGYEASALVEGSGGGG